MNIADIYDYLNSEEAIEYSKLSPESKLVEDLGIEGDDFSELIESFSKKYDIDMDSYLWYFHHREEGWNLGALIFKPPYAQVKTIPVTPEVLLAAAKTKVWPVKYPNHKLKPGRPDVLFNQVLFGGIAIFGVVIWLFERNST
ncbi:hypothetical protein A9Q79_01355 [Methylophaga sp. 42_25_T18]|nr:hypothetical protein A9Q79_01355 [Methylophaga sp. 42_25_T18]OUR86497.1 hypothetical protein A9Q92_05540 [Methylophaga sp. 42_8_T64]